MLEEKTIRVAEIFGKQPFGRRADDGDQNGEAFRHKCLIPALRSAERVIIELDGNETPYGSSFLDEAFGGLVRHGYFSATELKARIDPRHKLKNVRDRIFYYIESAKREEDTAFEASLRQTYGE